MTKLQSVLLKAGRRVIPSPQEEVRLNRVAKKVLRKVEAASLPFGEIKDVILGGSFAKGTWLSPRGAVKPTSTSS